MRPVNLDENIIFPCVEWCYFRFGKQYSPDNPACQRCICNIPVIFIRALLGMDENAPIDWKELFEKYIYKEDEDDISGSEKSTSGILHNESD